MFLCDNQYITHKKRCRIRTQKRHIYKPLSIKLTKKMSQNITKNTNLIIYFRNILNDETKSKIEKDFARKMLNKLLEELEDD